MRRPADRAVRPVPLVGADGLPLLGPLRDALSGSGPALAPHAVDRPPEPGATRPLAEDEDDDADPVAAVVSTTGSTGRAKHVLLPASALLASAGATHDALGGSGTWLLAVPAHTVAGVQVLVRSLVGGTRPSVLDLAGGFDPAAFARAAGELAARAPGRRYTSLVPAQLDLLLDEGGTDSRTGSAALAAQDALRSFDAVLVGGAALSPALRARATDAGVRVVGTYGMTETCGGCVYDGVPLPGVRVHVEPLDPTQEAPEPDPVARPADAGLGVGPDEAADQGPDQGLDQGVVGRVVVEGPVVARGYRGAGRGDAAVLGGEGFDAYVAGGLGTRRFRTADRGVLSGGVLRLLGRTDDVVVSGGANVALDAVDRVLRRQPGARDWLVVDVPSERWGAVVGALVVDDDPARPVDDEVVRAAVRRELGSASVPRLLRHVGRVPLAGVGKPDRAAAVRLLQEPAGPTTTAVSPAHARTPDLGDHGGPHPPTEEST